MTNDEKVTGMWHLGDGIKRGLDRQDVLSSAVVYLLPWHLIIPQLKKVQSLTCLILELSVTVAYSLNISISHFPPTNKIEIKKMT